MGVQKLKPKNDHVASLNNFSQTSAETDQDNCDMSASSNSCSNCYQTCSSADDKNNSKTAVIEFENRVFCNSCLRIYISSHYRRKLLRDITFDLRNIKNAADPANKSPVGPKPSNEEPSTRQTSASKHHSLTLDCLTFDLTSGRSSGTSSASTSPGSGTDSKFKRPKSCSDFLMDSPVGNFTVHDALKNGNFCKNCELFFQTSADNFLTSHNCVEALKENLASAQKTLESFKQRSKEQLKAFLHRENNLINYMVGLQADLLVQNHKHKVAIEKLEKQNSTLLEKVSQQQKSAQKVRFPDGAGRSGNSSRFQVVLHRDPNGGSLGFNVAGGVNKSRQDSNEENDSSSSESQFQIPRGLLVTRVSPDSIASRADIQAGDLIVSVNGTSLEKLSHNECIDVIKRTKSPLMVEVERPLEPNMVSSGTQTLASDTLFSGVGQVNRCDLISLSSSVTDLESVGLGSVDHDAVDYILSHCQKTQQYIQEVVLFKKSPDEDLGIIAEDGKDGSAIIKEIRPSEKMSSRDTNDELLHVGDHVIKVNGKHVENTQHFHYLMSRCNSSRLSILVHRNIKSEFSKRKTQEKNSSTLTTLTCDVDEVSGQKSALTNDSNEPKSDCGKVNDSESPKQSTDSEHHIDNEVFASNQTYSNHVKVLAAKRDEVLRRSNVSENGQKEKVTRKIRIKSDDGQYNGSDLKRFSSLKRENEAQNVYQNTAQTKPSSGTKQAQYHAKSYTMKHSNSRCGYEMSRPANEKTFEMKNSHSMTLSGKHLKKRRDSADVYESLRTRDANDDYDSEMELLLPKSRANRTERPKSKPSNRSRSTGSQNIYAQIDDITTDEDIPANQNAQKHSSRHDKKKGANEPSYDQSRAKRRVKKTVSPPLESVLEDKVLTLSKKQQSRLKARMIDGFATVTELMTHGVSSNPLVSVTTL